MKNNKAKESREIAEDYNASYNIIGNSNLEDKYLLNYSGLGLDKCIICKNSRFEEGTKEFTEICRPCLLNMRELDAAIAFTDITDIRDCKRIGSVE